MTSFFGTAGWPAGAGLTPLFLGGAVGAVQTPEDLCELPRSCRRLRVERHDISRTSDGNPSNQAKSPDVHAGFLTSTQRTSGKSNIYSSGKSSLKRGIFTGSMHVALSRLVVFETFSLNTYTPVSM